MVHWSNPARLLLGVSPWFPWRKVSIKIDCLGLWDLLVSLCVRQDTRLDGPLVGSSRGFFMFRPTDLPLPSSPIKDKWKWLKLEFFFPEYLYVVLNNCMNVSHALGGGGFLIQEKNVSVCYGFWYTVTVFQYLSHNLPSPFHNSWWFGSSLFLLHHK